MPKPAHCRVTFEGVIGALAAPVEQFAFGINFPRESLDADGNQVVDDALAASLAGAYNDNVRGVMPSDTHVTGVTVARIGADGLVERRGDGSYAQGKWAGDYVGPAPALKLPLQTALCISLNTMRAGATGKGRFFLPFPGYDLDAATKRLTVADTTAFAGYMKNFLNALGTIMTYAPQVVSSHGYMSEVTSVRVGRVPDTMRSRREDIPEGYVSVPLA